MGCNYLLIFNTNKLVTKFIRSQAQFLKKGVPMRIHSVLRIVLISIMSLFVVNNATASSSLSCSGSVRLCSSCRSESYSIHASQHANVNNSIVSSESHSFSMSGFLGNSDDYKIQERATARHVFYSNGKNILAIPYLDSNDGIWVNGDGSYGPGESPNTWLKLCPN